MKFKLKLRKIGNSAGVVLPNAALEHLNAGIGDVIFLEVITDGEFRLTNARGDSDRKQKMVESRSQRYRHALSELAK